MQRKILLSSLLVVVVAAAGVAVRARKHPSAWLWLAILSVFSAGTAARPAAAAESAGVTVRFSEYEGPATVEIRPVRRHEVQVVVDPKGETNPLALQVELRESGPDAWPALDAEVLGPTGQPVPARHVGIQWNRFAMVVPAAGGTFTIRAVEPGGSRPGVFPEAQRRARDEATGVSAAVCNWPDGRRAALSIRFDDSHRTHLSTAIPILREYGFRGTFMVNPGGWQRAEWEAVARQGDQEFANHSLRHRGSQNEEDTERDIGEAAKVIQALFPNRSKLVALNLGGGTQWVTSKTLRYYLDKYQLFDASSGSLGMDDVYGNRVAAIREAINRHLASGGWCRVHYHSIGVKGTGVTEENFRAALDVVKEHRNVLWIAGMADIYKYMTECRGARLTVESKGPSRVQIALSCSTDPELYDQPLALEIQLPQSWPAERVVVKDAQARVLTARSEQTEGETRLHFEVAPRSASFTVEKKD
ncbi:MAG: polysaccharide deacetylase family protein [Armatimonadetes bacterium]|nr:polysaccharide deacetylase family protein [Armatimonadota bacterium]